MVGRYGFREFTKFTFQNFQAFHRGDHMVFMAFLCYLGHFTYRSVPKAQFLLDVFTNIIFSLVPSPSQLSK